MDKTDEGLLGNEKIEDAIAALQQQPTQELLAHALTVVRRRMRENGQVIIAVEPNEAAGQMKLQAVKTSDGKNWWAVFTSFDEELKGGKSVMSTFMTDIGKLLEAALSEEEISGVIINPWNRTLMLDKTLIRIDHLPIPLKHHKNLKSPHILIYASLSPIVQDMYIFFFFRVAI